MTTCKNCGHDLFLHVLKDSFCKCKKFEPQIRARGADSKSNETWDNYHSQETNSDRTDGNNSCYSSLSARRRNEAEQTPDRNIQKSNLEIAKDLCNYTSIGECYENDGNCYCEKYEPQINSQQTKPSNLDSNAQALRDANVKTSIIGGDKSADTNIQKSNLEIAKDLWNNWNKYFNKSIIDECRSKMQQHLSDCQRFLEFLINLNGNEFNKDVPRCMELYTDLQATINFYGGKGIK